MCMYVCMYEEGRSITPKSNKFQSAAAFEGGKRDRHDGDVIMPIDPSILHARILSFALCSAGS